MTHLGNYLYTLRITAGFETTSDFIGKVKLPISEAYWRSLEAGKNRKRQIMMDTAKDLCNALCASPLLRVNRRQFFTHLLKDLLDEKDFNDVVFPLPLDSVQTLDERLMRMNRDIRVLKESEARFRAESSMVASDRTVEFLLQHPHFLPLVHHVYLYDETNLATLSSVMAANGITENFTSVITALLDYKIILVSGEKVSRYAKIFKVPNTPQGDALKSLFVDFEIKTSRRLERTGDPFDDEKTYEFSCITSFRVSDKKLIKDRFQMFLAELRAAETTSEHDSIPFYLSFISSPRTTYSKI